MRSPVRCLADVQAGAMNRTTAGADGSLRVAIDVGPAVGSPSGIPNAVAWTVEALEARGEVTLAPYVTSMRAAVQPPTRRLPIPAAAALRLWARGGPRTDRWLGRPDVVHGTNYVVPPTRCPRVVSVYDCWFLDHPDDTVADVRRAGNVLRRAIDEGVHVVTSSDATTRRLRELFDLDDVRTVLLGPPQVEAPPDERPASLPALDRGPYVLSLSTVERRKNIPTLIRAFGRVGREHPTVRLVVAGASGNDTGAVEREITRLEPAIAARVVRTGPVDDPAKRWLLHHARALAYPSLDEGFGFPILEAQAVGTPVVASTAGSIPQVAGPAALLSPPNDSEALAANLFWVVNDDEMYAKLVRRGRANLARFSWERTAAELVAVYRDVAEVS
jgi:glycosyltransferase involved in cell wall biosynthesis